jgi:hypothetical protein
MGNLVRHVPTEHSSEIEDRERRELIPKMSFMLSFCNSELHAQVAGHFRSLPTRC